MLRVLLIIAFLLFFVMFFSPIAKHIPFFATMTVTALILSISSLVIDRKTLRTDYKLKPFHISLGILAAATLYIIFFIGNYVSKTILPFASDQVSSIYLLKENSNLVLISLSMFFIIGPAEEIFWRAFIQKKLSIKYSPIKAIFITTALYAAVHIPSMNFMLIAAAAVCGLFWSMLYYKFKSPWPNIISHTLWDITIFILFPIV